MAQIVGKLAVIGQGLIGSSITRAAVERGIAREIAVTDASDKVRRRVREPFGVELRWEIRRIGVPAGEMQP